jgi:hypothetical protein
MSVIPSAGGSGVYPTFDEDILASQPSSSLEEASPYRINTALGDRIALPDWPAAVKVTRTRPAPNRAKTD